MTEHDIEVTICAKISTTALNSSRKARTLHIASLYSKLLKRYDICRWYSFEVVIQMLTVLSSVQVLQFIYLAVLLPLGMNSTAPTMAFLSLISLLIELFLMDCLSIIQAVRLDRRHSKPYILLARN